MRRRTLHTFVVAILLLMLTHGVQAKAVTVKLTISGAWLQRPLEITNPLALVNVWSGTRVATSWFDFPKPFIGAITSPPAASLPRYTITFYANDGSKVLVVYTLRYVPDPLTGRGYIYLPGHTEPDANWAMIRPGDGKWNLASEEWSAVINSQLAAATR